MIFGEYEMCQYLFAYQEIQMSANELEMLRRTCRKDTSLNNVNCDEVENRLQMKYQKRRIAWTPEQEEIVTQKEILQKNRM